MHELNCPICNTPAKYDIDNYLLMCPFCSTTFRFHPHNGEKEPYNDHFIVSNTTDTSTVKSLVIEWLKRLHHNPQAVEKEYMVTNIQGVSIPCWVVSVEAHTSWKGLIKKRADMLRTSIIQTPYLMEQGHFYRSYRWCIVARKNIFEYWGANMLHIPNEPVRVDWDGFPLDSTFSRGKLLEEDRRSSAYEIKEFFDFKFANGLPVLDIEISDDEALRRAKHHIENYHYRIAKLNVDTIIDYHTEIEVAGIQLIHLPFWEARYVYTPKTFLRYLQPPKEKHVLFEGYTCGVLEGELAIVSKDKLWINTLVTAIAGLIFLVLGGMWHPAFWFVSLFAFVISGFSAATSSKRAEMQAERKKNEDVITEAGQKNKEARGLGPRALAG